MHLGEQSIVFSHLRNSSSEIHSHFSWMQWVILIYVSYANTTLLVNLRSQNRNISDKRIASASRTISVFRQINPHTFNQNPQQVSRKDELEGMGHTDSVLVALRRDTSADQLFVSTWPPETSFDLNLYLALLSQQGTLCNNFIFKAEVTDNI